jgi:hypothetical protein
MKTVELSLGQVALVDDEDYEKLLGINWTASFSKHTGSYYAHARIKRDGKWITLVMAREIMSTPANLVCDHINHDTLDNQKSNLRNVSVKQNNENSVGRKTNKTGIKGVVAFSRGFRGHIKAEGKLKYSKIYRNIDDAISWRKEMETLHYTKL